MIETIDHIGIMTNDLQKSVEFYTDVLGFSLSNKIEMADVGFSAIFIEKNGSRIELMGYRGAIPKRSEGMEIKLGGGSIPINDHITFSVDDIRTTVTELKEKGVEFGLEPIQVEGGMKLASFKDPNGVLIELVEHPKQQHKSIEYIIV
ncbi:MAG TPA: VOC family protein [Candidatus Limnocylindrales bacterium]|nr:VOC family protein [Candidatus Limnocylindrales bacterium]